MPLGKYWVGEGEVLAKGICHVNNTYLDFGVYDLRNKNDSAGVITIEWPEYYTKGSYAICWTGLWVSNIKAILENLVNPDDVSDYCD